MQTRNEGIKVRGVGPGDLYIWSEELRERKRTVNDNIWFFTQIPGKNGIAVASWGNASFRGKIIILFLTSFQNLSDI